MSTRPTQKTLREIARECNRLDGSAGGNYLLVDTTTWRVGDEIGTEGTLWPSHIWPVKIRKTDADLVAEAYDRWLGWPDTQEIHGVRPA